MVLKVDAEGALNAARATLRAAEAMVAWCYAVLSL